MNQAFEATGEAAPQHLRYQNIEVINEGHLYDVMYTFFILSCKIIEISSLNPPPSYMMDLTPSSSYYSQLEASRSNNNNNLLLTESEGHTGEYWPEVLTVRTEHNDFFRKATEDQHFISQEGSNNLAG